MLFRNMRLSPTESYDPLQRMVGGVVLFVLMMLLYYLLKVLLGISSSGTAYALRDPLPDEVIVLQESGDFIGADSDATPGTEPARDAKPKYPIINSFVFLDLDGKPMDKDAGGESAYGDSVTDVGLDALDGSKLWVIQVASLRERDRADSLLEKLKDKQFTASISKSGRWYVVRLEPKKDRREAEQLLQKLRQDMGLKGMLMQK